MRLSTIFSTALTSSLASARIVGLAAPKTLAPGTPFTLTLITENYIQSVADIAVAWGYSPAPGHIYSLGSFISSSYLGPDKSNTLDNVTIEATVPQELSGEAWMGKQVVLGSAVYSLYGASSGPTVANINVTVTIGEETSEELVRNDGFSWGTAGQC